MHVLLSLHIIAEPMAQTVRTPQALSLTAIARLDGYACVLLPFGTEDKLSVRNLKYALSWSILFWWVSFHRFWYP